MTEYINKQYTLGVIVEKHELPNYFKQGDRILDMILLDSGKSLRWLSINSKQAKEYLAEQQTM